MNTAYLAMVLAQMGLMAPNGEHIRADDKFTAILSRQLESVKKTVYEIKYPALKAREFIPLSREVDPAAESIVYNEWDHFGMAAIISNYADDLPMVGMLAEQFVSKVVGIGNAYQYSVMDLRRAMMANLPLTAKLAIASREFIERKIDDLACFGHPASGLKGMFNHPNVTVVEAIDPGNGQRWAGGGDPNNLKTAQQMRDDLDLLVRTIISQSKGVHEPDTLVLPLDEFTRFAQTPTSQYEQTPILKTWLAANPYIRSVVPYFKLSTASETGGPRAWCYKRDELVATLEIPQEWEQLPPQAENLMFKVPCHARFGGFLVYQPLAMAYLDGL